MQGMNLDHRLEVKAKMDSRIEEVQRGAEKIKRIIDIFRQARSEAEHNILNKVYTPVDMIIDINNELKDRIPQEYKGKVRRRGKITLPIDGLSEECKIVDTVLETSVNEETKNDVATYYLKTCTSNGKYEPVAEVRWSNALELEVMYDNLSKLFKDLFKHEMNRGSCRVEQQHDGIIESIYCRNIHTSLNEHEYALVREMGYYNTQDIRFALYADIHETTGRKKATVKLEVFSNGDVKFDTKRE